MRNQFIPLNALGKEAVAAHRNIKQRYNIELPKPSRILVALSHQGKYTIATLRSGGSYAVGVAARNPTDRNSVIKGDMTALSRALRNMGKEG